jgi:uncharacterized protein
MTEKNTIKRRLLSLASLVAVASPLTLLVSVPATAQFFPFFAPYQQQQQQQQQQQYQYQERREAPADYSRAPSPKKPETPPTSTVVVMGDSMADWLAYGLEEAFADTPEIGIVRKYKAYSGLIRYESRSDLEWSSVAREIMNTEKPTVAVMMIGLSDRGPIRDRPPGGRPANPQAQPETPAAQPHQQNPDAESSQTDITALEASKGRGSSNEFRSEIWAELYSKKIADTIAAMKSRGVPVIWVGLPIIRGPKATSDALYLNDLYRAQAEKAGIIYVDVWDGFVDEAGKFVSSGPDVDGQTRRLRSPDGVYFTKFGARKLAHFVEQEINRVISTRALPVALPMDGGTQPSGQPRPGGPVARPLAGAVLPLTAGAAATGGDELLGSSSMRPVASDPIATRVLVKGEPVSPLKGRADDFVWPQGGATSPLPTANMIQEPGTIKPAEIPVAAPAQEQKSKPEAQVAQQQRRPRPAQSQAQTQTQTQQQQPAQRQSPFFFSPFSFFR